MNYLKPKKIVLIGASTGGPGLIESIVTSLDSLKDGCALIVAQHMDKLSLESFAKRLNRINPIEVEFVKETTQISTSKIYILSDTSVLSNRGRSVFLELQREDSDYYHPTIDKLFASASKIKDVIIDAYLLSGIGSDGAKGMLELKNVSQKTVAQDEETSIVYGMPKSAYELGASQKVMSIDEIILDIKMEV